MLDRRDIGADDRLPRGIVEIHRELQAGFVQPVLEALEHRQHQLLGGERRRSRAGAAAFDAGKRQHVLHQVRQAAGLAVECEEILAALFFLHRAALQHVGVELEGGERGPQFMGDRGNERGPAFAQTHDAADQQGDRGQRHDHRDPADPQRVADPRAVRGQALVAMKPERERHQRHGVLRGGLDEVRRPGQRFQRGIGEQVPDLFQQSRAELPAVDPRALHARDQGGRSWHRQLPQEEQLVADPEGPHRAGFELKGFRQGQLLRDEIVGGLIDDFRALRLLRVVESGLIADSGAGLDRAFLLPQVQVPGFVRRGIFRQRLPGRFTVGEGAAEQLRLLDREGILGEVRLHERHLPRVAGGNQTALITRFETQPHDRVRVGRDRAVAARRQAILGEQDRRAFRVHAPEREAGPFFQIGAGFGLAAVAFGIEHAAGQPAHRSEHDRRAKGERSPDHPAVRGFHGVFSG